MSGRHKWEDLRKKSKLTPEQLEECDRKAREESERLPAIVQPLPPGAKRVSVVFSPETYEKILYIAEHKGTNKTEALRQSVLLTEYLVKAAEEGAKIYIDRDGKLTELVL
jgi:hypothetical protein